MSVRYTKLNMLNFMHATLIAQIQQQFSSAGLRLALSLVLTTHPPDSICFAQSGPLVQTPPTPANQGITVLPSRGCENKID